MYVNPNKRGNMSIEKFYERIDELQQILGPNFELELFSNTLVTFDSKFGGYATIAPLYGEKYTLSFVKNFDSCVFYYDGEIKDVKDLISASEHVGVFHTLKEEKQKLSKEIEMLRKKLEEAEKRAKLIARIFETKK